VSICVITVENGWGTMAPGHVQLGAQFCAAVAQQVVPHVVFGHAGAVSLGASAGRASTVEPPPPPHAATTIAAQYLTLP